MADTIHINEASGFDSLEADGTPSKPYKSVQFAYLQHGGAARYAVRKDEADEEYKPAAKAALKKAANYADAQKKKAGKEQDIAVRQRKEEEERLKALEESKKIVIMEDPSLPKAVQINLAETRPEIVKLGSGEKPGTRVRVYGRVHRERIQSKVAFVVLRDGHGYLQCVFSGDLAKHYDIQTLTRETTMMLVGSMYEVPPGAHAPDNRELHVDYFEVMGKAPGGDDALSNKVQEKSADAQTLLDRRHLVLRGEGPASVMFVRDAVEFAFHTKYHELGEFFPSAILAVDFVLDLCWIQSRWSCMLMPPMNAY